MSARLLLLVLCAPILLAGCAMPGASLEPSLVETTRCVDPHPCGDEWPEGLEAPFDLAEVAPLDIVSHDGIPLETYVYLPALPEGVKAPVMIMSTPYPGSCPSNGGGSCIPRGDAFATSSRTVAALIEGGYAVVMSNVRGTGNSGGCFEMGGLNEQLDQVALVEQAATAPWSNGRVGMIGHSYPSYTAWMAAVQAPAALKTIVVSGHINDLYLSYHTPQGAAALHGGWFQLGYSGSLNLVPPLGGGPAHALVEHAPVAAERLCPDAARAALETQRSALVDARDAPYWEERNVASRIGEARAAVFSVSGFEDSVLLYHAFQDDGIWDAIQAPKRGIFGHWGHAFPPPDSSTEDAPFGPDWFDDGLLPWLDYWLKGIGERAPGEGTIVYETRPGDWRESTSWPPAGSRNEVLYLKEGALSPTPGGEATRFVAAHTGGNAWCSPASRVFLAEPQAEPYTIAGNVFAHLQVTSDRPGGIVTLDLVDVGEDGFTCEGSATFTWRWRAAGAADLRFHDGSMTGKDFPVGAPTAVRVDLNNQAWTIEPGRRLGLVVSGDGGGLYARAPSVWTPSITLGTDGAEASHLVVPLVDGTLGGAAPTLAYAPNPRAPRA